ISDSLEELDRLPLGEANDRLLPLRPRSLMATDAAQLARHAHGAHGLDPDVEQHLDGAAHVGLARVRIDGERDLVALLAAERALLRDERTTDDVLGSHVFFLSALRFRGAAARPDAFRWASPRCARPSGACGDAPGDRAASEASAALPFSRWWIASSAARV